MSPFSKLYTAILEEYCRPVSGSDGEAESQIIAAESRLSLRLPCALRDFYLRVGRLRDVHDCHNHLARLTLPDQPRWSDRELSFENGHLYFYDENQRAVLWCIEASQLNLDDPPVLQDTLASLSERFEECERTSQFLAGMMYFHLTMGAAPFYGAGESDEEQVSRLKEQLDFKMEFMGSRIFARSGRILFLTGTRTVQISALTRGDFTAIESLLKPKWTFKSTDIA